VTKASDTHRTIRQRIDPGTLGKILKLGTAPSLTGDEHSDAGCAARS